MNAPAVPVLRLKPREERRLRAGHPWVFSNEVDTAVSPLRMLEPGSEAVIEDSRGKPMGRAYVNPHSLICARLFSHDPNQSLDRELLSQRMAQALALRERLFGEPYYRLVFAESDGLPGLVVDRYGDDFVVQSGTAGMEAVLEDVAAVLADDFGARSVTARNESSVRELEQLQRFTRSLIGTQPEEIRLQENGCTFSAPLAAGQKTGWFYDHRSARRRIAPLCQGGSVLDVFSYCGAWGVTAAVHGASDVICVDSSATALAYAERNAQDNDVADRVSVRAGDAGQVMRELLAAGAKFDTVILDPPAFIKRRKDHKAGSQGYRNLNELAVRLVKPGGFLVTASCSMHLGQAELLDIARAAGRHNDRQLQLVAADGQAEDHPVHPAITETAYLKTLLMRVLPSY